jgi:hypothetical protein|tara:strand:+ start:720 stop:1010 length:291 start_codon:yes stop_codon:yes gene_type:complete
MVSGTTDLSTDNRDEFSEINGSVAIFIELRNEFCKLAITEVYVVVSKHGSQVSQCYPTVVSQVEASKGSAIVLEICDKLVNQHCASLFGSAFRGWS